MIHHSLSSVIFFPIVGSLLILCISRKEIHFHRFITLVTTFLTFVMSCFLVFNFDKSESALQFLDQHAWISSLNISYLVGVDGLSLPLILLTTLIFFLITIASWNQKFGSKGYFILYLILETMTLGTFSAQDLFLFFTFWTGSLLPIYFIVSIWGHKHREYAATKFFLFQLVGCALILLGMFAIYYSSPMHTFNVTDLVGRKFIDLNIDFANKSFRFEYLVYILMLVGMAVRIPMFPFHNWFAHIQGEAPFTLSVIIAAIFLKTGAYALVRFNYALFPEAAQWMAQWLTIVGIVNIIYGGLCAINQTDLRKIAAYSTMSHMGFVLLGISIFSSTALHGAFLQMIAHGAYGALLFFLIGLLGERTQCYELSGPDGSLRFGGLVSRAPIMTGFFTIAVFSAVGVPGLGAFTSEILVFLGVFPESHLFAITGLFGVLLTASYFLWMFRKVFFGVPHEKSYTVTDLSTREKIFLIPLVLLCFLVGTYPTPLLNMTKVSIENVLHKVKNPGQPAQVEKQNEGQE